MLLLGPYQKKVYCFSVSPDNKLIAIGGKEIMDAENKKHIPFVSIHRMEKDLPLHGTNDQVIKYIENLTKDQIDQFADSIKEKMKDIVKQIKVSYKMFFNLKECIFHLKFLNTEKKMMVGSDFNANLFILQVHHDYSLEIYKQFRFHEGDIQGFALVNHLQFYSCSTDNTISKVELDRSEFRLRKDLVKLNTLIFKD